MLKFHSSGLETKLIFFLAEMQINHLQQYFLRKYVKPVKKKYTESSETIWQVWTE